jgi:transcription antitermination factor NusG
MALNQLTWNDSVVPSRMELDRVLTHDSSGGLVDGVEESYFGDDLGPAGASLDNGCDLDICPGHWYALYVRSRHEKVVESGLRGKGYVAFSPFYRTKRKRVDRITAIDVPLFPGYVFCLFDSNKRLPILTTPGVVGVVGPRNRPEPVDDNEIASIRTLALSGRPVQPWPFLRSGQRIRLQAGPLTGAEGIFVRVKNECHLVVSITLLQRAVSVVVDKDTVTPLFLGERWSEASQN